MGTTPSANGGYRAIALIVASAFFMEQLDSTIIATALPAMAQSLHADPVRMNLAMTVYMLALAAFIPASGKIAERFGTRNVFRFAIGLFVVSSILCGMSLNLPWLIGARLLQGAAGAMMVPVGRLALLRSVEKSQLVAAMSWMLFPAMIGPVVGPLIGGVVTTYLSWHWIFYINVPIGLAGMVLTSIYIPDVREEAKNTSFDTIGFVLSAATLATLILGLETLGHEGPRSPLALSLLAGFAACALVFWRHNRRSANPVVDFTLMRIQTFNVSVTAGLFYRVAYGAFPFLMPLMLQLGFGLSAAQSGAITFVGAAGGLVMKATSAYFLRTFGYRNVLVWNGLISSVTLAVCGLFRPEWPLLLIYAVLLFGGLARSLQFNAFGTITYADIPPPRMSAATSLASINQQVTMALGIGVAALVLDIIKGVGGHAALTLADFTIAFLAVGALGALAVPQCLRLPANAGAELSGRRADGSQPAPIKRPAEQR